MIAQWVEDEMQGLDLDHQARNQRCRRVLSDISQRPHASLPAAVGGANADVQAIYRFMANEDVEIEALLKPHREATQRRFENHRDIVLVQDTSEVDVTRHEQKVSGAGPLDNGARFGGFLHLMQAFSESGTPLGTVFSKQWSRPDEPKTKRSKAAREKAKYEARQRPIAEKESYRWVEGIQAAKTLSTEHPHKTFICISDSESDIFEVFAEMPAGKRQVHLVVRACQDRAVVTDGTDDDAQAWRTLWANVEQTPVKHTATISIRGRDPKVPCNKRDRDQARASRVATVEIRATSVTLRGPHRVGGNLSDTKLNAVLVREINPPAGEAPVEWLLLTTLPIDSKKKIERVISLYALRWGIELFFRMLKQGCRIEERRFEYQDRVERFVAISLIVAWRICYMCHLGRECPEISCEAVFTRTEWQLAYHTSTRRTPPKTPPTLPAMIRLVAQLGGYINRVRSDEPGIQTLWEGLQRLHDLTLGYEFFAKTAKNSA